MIHRPQPSPYRPERTILSLGEAFYDEVEAAQFPRTMLRFRNQRWAEAVGLGHLSEEQWLRHFGRFEPMPENLERPLALRYHGHQFRVYNPDIGDGRGFLFAQMRDNAGRLLDLGTKGSGQTPYSRFGDGRLTLKGGIREVLATEMLEALGVETSKSLSLIETGEALERNDEPSPTRSSVLVRLQHSHIRIGTFQRLAYLGEAENMRTLTDYCLEHYYGEDLSPRHCEDPGLDPGDEAIQSPSAGEAGLLRSARNDDGSDAAARLLGHVAKAAARLAASYIVAGFVHGVLNSDNIAITAESFDYGPWRFTPFWDGTFTAAYFDHIGLYAFGRQPEAIHWDVVQLARSLTAIAEPEVLTPALEGFSADFQDALAVAVLDRLGVRRKGVGPDSELLVALETALARKTVEIDRFFFDWRGGRRRGPSPADARYEAEDFAKLSDLIHYYEPAARLDHPYWSDEAPCSMHIDEVEAIWARIDEADDWSLFDTKIEAVRRMGEAMRGRP
ncbi:protein adenylyltransferase SelO family protein [Sphingosinicella humi]|uniref:YdiU family protein n=1 Tax=Allosphingosinicella humi TaxID=2068657 RepID=A0A2U2IZP8_9SPHN|nr:protein adenylyltransferase SelO family protein [Sphingosinicella humi]PWG01556.1 YdiU family protein [Sphingosinicella humi]